MTLFVANGRTSGAADVAGKASAYGGLFRPPPCWRQPRRWLAVVGWVAASAFAASANAQPRAPAEPPATPGSAEPAPPADESPQDRATGVPSVDALPEGSTAGDTARAGGTAPPAGGAPEELTVTASRPTRAAPRTASSYRVGSEVVHAAPHAEGADVLRAAPGVYIGRGEGGAVAHNYMLRGFDAEHGQDIQFRVSGLPINLPGHIHGQGYSDLGFLIAETVERLQVREGVSDVRQGDFAVAGSIDIELGVPEGARGTRLNSSYGAFGAWRHLLLWAPSDGDDETVGAAQISKTDGFGQNRAGASTSAIVQRSTTLGNVHLRAIGIAHLARSDLAGVLRLDDVRNGEVCFDCVYPLATAQAQNANAQRVLGGIFADFDESDTEQSGIGLWVSVDEFRLQENFTGFLQRSRTLEGVAGRGDLVEQRNETLSLGLTGHYRKKLPDPANLGLEFELGTDSRLDRIEQQQNLLDAAVRSQTWDQRVDAAIVGVDLGYYAGMSATPTSWLAGSVGFRGDTLSYAVNDRLGNFAPLSRPQDSFIAGFRRSALGTAWGPRASLEARITPSLSALAAYGEGYRSPVARTLDDGEPAPFAKVRSADVGVRMQSGRSSATVTAYETRLSDDLAFDTAEGRAERIGPTARRGFVLHAEAHPVPWVVASLSATWVKATLQQTPPGSAEEPDPALKRGDALPFVPPLVLRLDVGAEHELPLSGLAGAQVQAGAGLSYLSARPLPYGTEASPVPLLDTSLAVHVGRLSLATQLFNVTDTEYSAVEYTFPSDWDPDDGVRPRTPARHSAAGSPRTWLVSLGVQL